jgi:hypothetical protein
MARSGWVIAAGLFALGALGACGDDGASDLPARSFDESEARRAGVPQLPVRGRAAGGDGGGRLAGNGDGVDSGVIVGGDPRLPLPRGADTGAGIPGATLPDLPGDPPERHTRRGLPGATFPALPQDTVGGGAIPVSPLLRGDDREREMLTGMLEDHARTLIEAQSCAEGATDADVVAFCRYIAEARRGEMEWLSSWLGERWGGDSPGR